VFASGSPLSVAATQRIHRSHDVQAIVVPDAPTGLRQWLRNTVAPTRSPLAELGLPLVPFGKAASLLGSSKPDLIVVASFPRLLPEPVLGQARSGALNLHMSCLPRHRGIDPVFWTYWDDDTSGGVTVHWMNERLDAGDIAAQAPLPLERGLASRAFYGRLAHLGVALLAGVLDRVAAGDKPRTEQRAELSTYRSAADVASARIPLAQWPCERVWHVLAGLGDQFHGLLSDSDGRQIRHGRATHYTLTPEVEPARIDRVDDRLVLHCRDGLVFVESLP
jgi:methionyl-tRNA formyltransferase